MDMMRFHALFDSRAWYDLVPDQNHQMVAGGFGASDDLD